eukprot:757745-Hanusia_phi.AAC.4
MMVLGLGVADANRFQEAWVMNCDHTFPDGTSYDLSPLTRTAGRPDYVGKDKMGNLYYINGEIPKECRILQKDIRSPVYQVRNDSFCHWLGMENSHSWDYIEKGSPYVGVQLTYSNGEYCQEGMNRRVKLQMYCDHLGRLGSVGKIAFCFFFHLCLQIMSASNSCRADFLGLSWDTESREKQGGGDCCSDRSAKFDFNV